MYAFITLKHYDAAGSMRFKVRGDTIQDMTRHRRRHTAKATLDGTVYFDRGWYDSDREIWISSGKKSQEVYDFFLHIKTATEVMVTLPMAIGTYIAVPKEIGIQNGFPELLLQITKEADGDE